jgi:TonB-dependent starch-binding outer membrane protein SusC
MKKLYLLLISLMAFASLSMAQRLITGRVTDESGNPVVNASVTVKGSSTGVNTRQDGSYSITVDNRARILVFSYVDRATEEITIGEQSTINASLRQQNRSLDEVVVVAYGSAKKGAVTGTGKQTGNQCAECFIRCCAGNYCQ